MELAQQYAKNTSNKQPESLDMNVHTGDQWFADLIKHNDKVFSLRKPQTTSPVLIGLQLSIGLFLSYFFIPVIFYYFSPIKNVYNIIRFIIHKQSYIFMFNMFYAISYHFQHILKSST